VSTRLTDEERFGSGKLLPSLNVIFKSQDAISQKLP